MKFNEYVWKLYLNTEEAKNALEVFSNFSIYMIEKKELIFEIYKNVKLNKDTIDKEYFYEVLNDAIDFDKESDRFINDENEKKEDRELFKNVSSFDKAKHVYIIEIEGLLTDENGELASARNLFSDGIVAISLQLYKRYPEYFFPYFFDGVFFKLQDIFEEFNIPLPDIPGKKKHIDRALYYVELCKVLHEFRLLNNFSYSELCIFLYCFAPNFVRNPLKEKIPTPTKVYISGATKEDTEWINKLKDKNTITGWAGNLNTQPGDILLVYGVTPYSAINSIWQAISYGYPDPFAYYMEGIWVSNFIKIPPITFEELQKNKVLSQKGLVNAHMQGVSGTPCTKIEYQEIIKILKEKSFDTSILPELPDIGFNNGSEDIFEEKDVEQKLLEPLLEKLDYTSKNWIRQMPLRMGRGIRYYPDYVINPKTTRGEEKADFIWEAKLSISNDKKLREDFYQAKSYALRLKADGLGLIALEGIWVSFSKDDFSFEKIEYFNWNDINNFDIFNKLLIKIGVKTKN